MLILKQPAEDYIFDNKMLALQGNTAPYLQYAYTRAQHFRKVDAPDFTKVELQLKAPEELALDKHLMNFGQTLEMVAQDYRPNFCAITCSSWRGISAVSMKPVRSSRRSC